jgi:DNA-directed RNA polymerase II subunit RPB2
MFNLTGFKTLVEDEDFNEMTGQRVLFANPLELSKKKGSVKLSYQDTPAAYETLDEYGYPKLNTKIKEGSVYLGKVRTTPTRSASSLLEPATAEDTIDERSAVADKTLSGIVDNVFVYMSEKGRRQCKIRLRKVRTPVLGDKHASRHAQKGTIGMILPAENMPFTKDGIAPDLIINPHAIPTRMTIGHLIECVLGKLGSLEGEFYDGTPFCGQNIEACYEALEKHGYDRYGDEMMYNGITGEQIPTHIFVGPTYILRLKHMVLDKINYRSRGEAGYNQITKQPVKSRAKGGGLRIGEMENWAIYSHGMSSFIKESMMERSDRFVYKDDNGNVIETPYAAKQFMNELHAMNLNTTLMFEDGADSDDENEVFVQNEVADNT